MIWRPIKQLHQDSWDTRCNRGTEFVWQKAILEPQALEKPGRQYWDTAYVTVMKYEILLSEEAFPRQVLEQKGKPIDDLRPQVQHVFKILLQAVWGEQDAPLEPRAGGMVTHTQRRRPQPTRVELLLLGDPQVVMPAGPDAAEIKDIYIFPMWTKIAQDLC